MTVLEAAFLPRDAAAGPRVFVLVDVLRATTSIALLLDRGCVPLLLAAGDEAIVAARLAHEGILVCAEDASGAIAVGADLSPSLRELGACAVEGRPVILRTTNGTLAAENLCRADATCYAGALLNGRAVMTAAVESALAHGVPLQVVCAGRERGGVYTIDDVYCTGFLIEEASAALRARGAPVDLRDSAKLAHETYQRAADPYEGIARSESARVLRGIGCEDDIRIAARANVSRAVPLIERDSRTATIAVRPR